MSVRLEVLAEEFVNGPDNGTEEALERLLRAVAAAAWDEGNTTWEDSPEHNPYRTESRT